MNNTKKHISRQALLVLEEVFGDVENIELPVSLYKILDKYQLKVHTVRFRDSSIVGACNKKNKKIYICMDDSPNYQRVVISYLIGVFLNSTENEDFAYRQDLEYSKDDKISQDVVFFIKFMNVILMPRILIKKYWPLVNDVHELSKIFGVPFSFMLRRLYNLGYIYDPVKKAIRRKVNY